MFSFIIFVLIIAYIIIASKKPDSEWYSVQYQNKKVQETKKVEERKEQVKRVEKKKTEPIEYETEMMSDMEYFYSHIEDTYGISVSRKSLEKYKELEAKVKYFNELPDKIEETKRKIKELEARKEILEKEREEKRERMINRTGKQMTIDDLIEENKKQEIKETIRKEKEKEALNNGGIQMNLFDNEIKVTDEDVKQYKQKQHEDFKIKIEEIKKRLEESNKRYEETKKRLKDLGIGLDDYKSNKTIEDPLAGAEDMEF